MIEVVLDASVVLRWAFDDERDREGALRVADALANGRLIASGAPNLFLEGAAALVVGIIATSAARARPTKSGPRRPHGNRALPR